MKTSEWMEKLRIATKTQSWYAVRKALKISDAAIYKLRDGESIMSAETARKAAEFLNVRDDEIFIDTMVEKSEKRGDIEAIAYWKRRAEALGRRAAVVLLSIAAGFTFHNTESTASLLVDKQSPPHYGAAEPGAAKTLYYVKSDNGQTRHGQWLGALE